MKVGDLVRVSSRKDHPEWDEEWEADSYGIFLGMRGNCWVYETVPPGPFRGNAHPEYWKLEVVNEDW